jgi:PAS domain S-box-containing protein
MQAEPSDIRRALESGDFFPVFQPLVELKTGQIAAFEILARWQHSELGTIAPGDFIPQVQASGLMNRLTEALLEKAFLSTALAGRSLMLTVNLSPAQLQDPGLPAMLAAVAARGGFPLSRLTIEVTESALVDDLARAATVARELKTLGCSLALDDFGTGYSSLKHLQALPFDKLKVDRSFVSSMTDGRESRKIVAAVVGLGQSLGLMTVAEGVETQAQADMLLWLGCDLGQGWRYGKPAPMEEIPRMLAVPARAAVMPTPMDGSSLVGGDLLPAQRMAQIQAIYDGAPVGLCFLDQKMRYVSLNRRLAEMNGSPAVAHLGRTVAEVIPRLFPVVEPYIRRALRGEPVTGVEVQQPASEEGGQAQTILLSYQPARDEAGEVVGVSVAIMDITERKHMEEALRESEDHYRHMIELSPHVPWVLDTKGAVIEASPRWEALTGQTMDEAMGHGWLRMLHPGDVAPTVQAIRNSLRTGESIDVYYHIHRPDGEWILMRSRGSPRFGPSGKIICIYGLVEEVHGPSVMTDELRACEAELRAALEAVPVGVILADASDGSIFMVNPAASALFGGAFFPGQRLSEYTRLAMADARGRTLTPDENPLARAVLRGETTDSQSLIYKRADGRESRFSLTGKPIHAEDGQLIGGLMMVRDMALSE